MFIDLHTHHNRNGNATISIVNAGIKEIVGNALCSVGIHPWNITEQWREQFEKIASTATLKKVAAIGECGIDKIKGNASIGVQKEVLEAHAALAERTGKPLILHCVKGADEIIALRKEMKPRQAWIIHGFRGNPQQAAQFLKAGLHLSYGEKFNKESLAATPPDRLFVESDTSDTPISKLYATIATERNTSIEALSNTIKKNAETCNIGLAAAHLFAL